MKDFIVEFKSNRGEEARRPLYVSIEVAQGVIEQMDDRNISLISFYDEKGNLKESVSKREIKAIRKTDDIPEEDGIKCWRCDYGLWHDMKTGCFKKIGGKGLDWKADCSCKDFIKKTPEAYFQECKVLFEIESRDQLTFQMGKDYIKYKQRQLTQPSI